MTLLQLYLSQVFRLCFVTERSEEYRGVWAEWYAPNVRLESLLILEAYRWETLAYPNTCIPSLGPSQEQTRKQVCLANNQMDKHSKHIMWRGNATKQVLPCESRISAETSLVLGTCSSLQFSIRAVPVGFQRYKSIWRSCFAHSYKLYLFSWFCEVRVWWGRSLQSITSCSLLLDLSSVDYISLTVPTASCSHTCCWLFYCSSQICSSCFETLQWERAFINLAQMDIGLWLLHIIWAMQKEPVCECSKAVWCLHAVWMYCCKLGAFRERHSLLTSWIHKRTHWRNFFLVNFLFNFLLNSEKEKYWDNVAIKKKSLKVRKTHINKKADVFLCREEKQ